MFKENKVGPSDCTFKVVDPDSDIVTYKVVSEFNYIFVQYAYLF